MYVCMYVCVCVSSGSYTRTTLSFLNKINGLVFVTEEECVYCEVGNIAVHAMKAYRGMEV
jgi:hypothetical protein